MNIILIILACAIFVMALCTLYLLFKTIKKNKKAALARIFLRKKLYPLYGILFLTSQVSTFLLTYCLLNNITKQTVILLGFINTISWTFLLAAFYFGAKGGTIWT